MADKTALALMPEAVVPIARIPVPRAGLSAAALRELHHPTCGTCRRRKVWVDRWVRVLPEEDPRPEQHAYRTVAVCVGCEEEGESHG